MSRIGKSPVQIPEKVSVNIDGLTITVKGPKGELKRLMPDGVDFVQKENQIVVTPSTTKRYSKEKELLAVPFDKGVGICLMKKGDYETKLDAILQLPQFEKVETKRKNAKHPVRTEEERVKGKLKELLEQNRISKDIYDVISTTGSQPARLYGLAKVHKTSVPTRPVLSMPG